MRILLLSALLPLVVMTCKQEEQVKDTATLQSTGSAAATKDSAAATIPEIKPAEARPELQVSPIDYHADLGRAVFTDGSKTLIGFNTETQKGEIRINNRTYTLNKLAFTDNNYEITGDGIKITAADGNFQEMTSDCSYGTFPEVKISLNGKETILKNIKVQDCPNYH